MQTGFLSLWQAGATLHCGVWASLYGDFSCGAQAPGTRASVVGSVVTAHGLSCSESCGIFSDQGSTQCSLHCKVDS